MDRQQDDPQNDISGDIPFPPVELERLKNRRWILKYAKQGGVGAEIGVFRGHFSEVLAETLQPGILFLVDPWTKIGEKFGWGENSLYTGYGRLTTRYALEDTRRRIARFQHLDIRLVESFAHEFVQQLTLKLDWAYLDASHEFRKTLKELHMLDGVLQVNGVIMGDDWQPDPAHKHHGVFRAVNEFAQTCGYDIVAAGPATQWCIRRKPSAIPDAVKKTS